MFTATLHSALPALSADGAPPEWLHLVPAGTSRGTDGRGPYRLIDATTVIQASLAAGPLVLDENHATDFALKTGIPAPAMGWIAELQARDDGIWGRVQWTPVGAERVAQQAYRGVSPVLLHEKGTGRIVQLMRAALTNVPNLPQLKTLHSQEPTMDLNQLREALGLPADADEAAILAAVTTARQSQASLQRKLDDTVTTVVALQAQVDATTQATRRDRAERVIDEAIKAGKPIKPARDYFVDMHMADPAKAEEMLAKLPDLNAGGATPPKLGADGKPQPTSAEAKVIAALGISPEDYAASKAQLGLTEGAA